jgi:2'-5' RNA ligase
MSNTFLLLEVLDPVVNAFLWRMRDILAPGKRKGRGPIHLTVRGPYESDLPSDVLNDCSQVIRHDVIRISECGRFSNPGNTEIVFLKVDSPNLKKIWWKRDYPIDIHGFNPHITILKTSDPVFADIVSDFLRQEQIEFLVAEHRLTWYRPDQPNFFTTSVPTVEDADRLADSSSVDSSMLDRLEEIRDDYNLKSARRQLANTDSLPRAN